MNGLVKKVYGQKVVENNSRRHMTRTEVVVVIPKLLARQLI